jgi:methylated-DNA-protein-cysteine methyltransferase-like protein
MRTLKVSEKNRDFFSQVYQVVREIPRGRVTSYGAIAKFLGSAGSARMVGWAMNASHKQIENIPAHRVVNRNGILTGKHHFNPSEKMIQLLEFEGVIVKNDEVRDFDKVFWDPIIELDIE